MTRLQQGGNYEEPLVDRGARGGTVIRILLLALVLIGVAIAFVFFQQALDNEIVLGLLGVLAMVGIFFMVSSINRRSFSAAARLSFSNTVTSRIRRTASPSRSAAARPTVRGRTGTG